MTRTERERAQGRAWWGRAVLGAALLGVVAFAGSGPVQNSATPGRAAPRSLQFSRVLDLSHVIEPGMPLALDGGDKGAAFPRRAAQLPNQGLAQRVVAGDQRLIASVQPHD